MRIQNSLKILSPSILGILLVSGFQPTTPPTNPKPLMVSYNPAPTNNFHAPLSSMSILALANATPNSPSLTSSSSQPSVASNLKTIRQNALRFTLDETYFSQSEMTIAVDPNNPSHVVGGFNDGKHFYCPFLPAYCGSSFSVSLSGLTTSSTAVLRSPKVVIFLTSTRQIPSSPHGETRPLPQPSMATSTTHHLPSAPAKTPSAVE